MYSFFWRIFLTFWLTILIVELFTAWFAVRLSESEIHPILEKQNQIFVADSNRAVAVLEAEGLRGLREWLQRASNLQAIDEIFVVNQRREEINHKPLPDNITDILGDTHADPPLPDYKPIKYILTSKATAPDTEEYLVITTFRDPHRASYLFAPQRVAFGVIVSGLICFLLARYFTSPLNKLRRSTQTLMTGEFNTSSIQNLRHRHDEFGALAVDFEKMAARLSDLLTAKRQLLRDISHELRSPLARIRVALGLVRKKHHADDSDELDRIEREIERLESLISELMMFVRIRSSNTAESMTNVDIRELLDHIVEDAQYEKQQDRSKNTIKLHCPPGIEVWADAHLLHRAIENIVRNACYYSPEQSVIHIRCEQGTDDVRIVVEDFGPGVPDDMLEPIFQPFVRVSSAREEDTGGSGIGLAIAKQLIDVHGGTLTAQNKKEGSGLIVTLSLPVRRRARGANSSSQAA